MYFNCDILYSYKTIYTNVHVYILYAFDLNIAHWYYMINSSYLLYVIIFACD